MRLIEMQRRAEAGAGRRPDSQNAVPVFDGARKVKIKVTGNDEGDARLPREMKDFAAKVLTEW